MGVGTVLADGCRCLDPNQSSLQEQHIAVTSEVSLVCMLSSLPCSLRVVRSFETIETRFLRYKPQTPVLNVPSLVVYEFLEIAFE